MDDLRAAVDRAVALTPAVRLITVDAADLVEADALAVYAAFTALPAPRRVVADPLRLPLIAGFADRAVVRLSPKVDPAARLRELWRVLAPAGSLIVVLPLPASLSLWSLIGRRALRRRLAAALAAAMFEADDWQMAGAAVVVRAGKRDGLTPPARTAAARRPARAQRVRTKTA